ncbi:hypothetical protein SKAU_G00038800 [Synaphobranchus kaupii]|uniref:Uncharacterized protein n=1 Tax=Synaphobranchus kaupii TaxID=118154 RepID=A0A9Q1GHW4_SYNKA|nr:hypothetical protein SKAU_G00038800 [Synaphobranchus kaupii]
MAQGQPEGWILSYLITPQSISGTSSFGFSHACTQQLSGVSKYGPEADPQHPVQRENGTHVSAAHTD